MGRTRETTSSPRTLGGQSADPERSLVPFLNVERARLVRRLAGGVSHDDPPRSQCRGRARPSLTIDRRFELSSVATRVNVWFLAPSNLASFGLKEPRTVATRFTGGRRIHQLPRPARRTCSFTALGSRRAPRDPDEWSRVQPSGHHSVPARRVVWDMPSECPGADGFLFRAARRYAAGAGTGTCAHTYARTSFALGIFFIRLDVSRVG